MAPLRGWAPRGQRLIGKAPHGRWRTLTFLAALRVGRIEAPCLFDGPINGQKFLAYVEQAFAKLKHWLRQAQARSIEETNDAIGSILERFHPKECAAYLKNSGYASA